MTYEYVCTACGHAWEAEQSISAAALKTCPKCGTDHAKRQVSGGAGFILKGGGWYADGYGSSKGGGASTTSASSTDAAASSSSSSETKTETKTEAAPAKSTGSTSTT
ncbi:MAG: zinc ribbon domain-containing protein [Myxococcales bacterium]